MNRTALYRHFDAGGALLYVGISSSLTDRMHQHTCQSSWFGEIATVTVQHFDDRNDAVAAERVAIATEKPLHNKAWNSAGGKAQVNEIVAVLTVDAMCAALGVGTHAVRYTRFTGAFPGNWYGTLLSMCEAAEIPCPMEAFTWKAAAASVVQGVEHDPIQ